MNECIKCSRPIQDEFFEGVNGKLCKECLKDLQVYHALKSMNLVKEVKGERA